MDSPLQPSRDVARRPFARLARRGADVVAALLLGATLSLSPRTAASQPIWGHRTSAYQIGGWSDLTFAGAAARYEITLDVNPAASTVGTISGLDVATLSGARDRFWAGDGSYVSISGVTVASPTLMTGDVTLGSADPGLDPSAYPGWMQLGYVTDVVDAGPGAAARSAITRGVVGDRWALTFDGGGFGFLDGGRFDVVVDVAGDWTDPARFDLLGVNAGWTVDAPTFTGATTRFHAFTAAYVGDTDAPGGNPNMRLRLWGDLAPSTTAPEPYTAALVLVGLVPLAVLRRRRAALDDTAPTV